MAILASEIDARIAAYEARYSITLTRTERESLRVLAVQQPTELRPQRHPLGNNADPTADHYTRANRAAVKSCLAAYWDGTLAGAVNKHEDTKTGVALADRFVSLLEISSALKHIRDNHSDLMLRVKGALILYVELRLRDGWTVPNICQHANISERTYYNIETDTLHAFIDAIWHDPLGVQTQTIDFCKQSV